MASIAASPLAGSTVVYNTVQWGGSDSTYKSLPPTYSIRGEDIYDDAQRMVIAKEYTLGASAFFYHDSENSQSTQMDAIKRLLSSPGKTLTITGLGFVKTPKPDLNWGPKVLYCEWQPTGNDCCELTWAIQFRVSECASNNIQSGQWTAFNWDESWENDYEGRTRRTISGYVEIAQLRKLGQTAAVVSVDQVRDQLAIIVPNKFKRVTNSWKRNPANNRIEFAVTDEQLEGDAYPDGCSLADGFCTFKTDPRTSFASGDVTMGMTIKTGPGTPPAFASAIWFGAVAAKQKAMQNALGQSTDRGTVIPIGMSITNRKYDGSRITDAQIQWTLSGGAGTCLTAAGVWEPLTVNDYQLWRTSMTRLWGNRGASDLRSLPSEDILLDACSGINQAVIGGSANPDEQSSYKPKFSFQCPTIPPDGGWIRYQPTVTQVRNDNVTVHRKAVTSSVQYFDTNGNYDKDSPVPYGGGKYSLDETTDHVLERGGLPDMQILLQFKGLRFKYVPNFPDMVSYGGARLTLLQQNIPAPVWVADVFECPVWAINGWRLYQVSGYLDGAYPIGSTVSQGAPNATFIPGSQ